MPSALHCLTGVGRRDVGRARFGGKTSLGCFGRALHARRRRSLLHLAVDRPVFHQRQRQVEKQDVGLKVGEAERAEPYVVLAQVTCGLRRPHDPTRQQSYSDGAVVSQLRFSRTRCVREVGLKGQRESSCLLDERRELSDLPLQHLNP